MLEQSVAHLHRSGRCSFNLFDAGPGAARSPLCRLRRVSKTQNSVYAVPLPLLPSTRRRVLCCRFPDSTIPNHAKLDVYRATVRSRNSDIHVRVGLALRANPLAATASRTPHVARTGPRGHRRRARPVGCARPPHKPRRKHRPVRQRGCGPGACASLSAWYADRGACRDGSGQHEPGRPSCSLNCRTE